MENISENWYKTWWGMALIAIAAIILIMLSVFVFYVFDLAKRIDSGEINKTIKKTELTASQIQKIEGIGNNWFGTSSPAITLVYFDDYACPICKAYNNTFRQIGYEYKDKIKIIIRDLPLHNESVDLAMAARCAGEQEKFLAMHDLLFQNQGVKTKDELTNIAKRIGIDISKFTTCFDNKKYSAQIQKDYIDAEDLGVQGTPTWFIEGQMISGDIPYNNLKSIIDKLITNQ